MSADSIEKIIAEMREAAQVERDRSWVGAPHGADEWKLDDWADRIERALAGQGEGWRPIQSAPKDEYVLVSCGPGGMIEACQPTEFVSKQYPWIDSYGNHVVGPEHWMPLPEPPR